MTLAMTSMLCKAFSDFVAAEIIVHVLKKHILFWEYVL